VELFGVGLKKPYIAKVLGQKKVPWQVPWSVGHGTFSMKSHI